MLSATIDSQSVGPSMLHADMVAQVVPQITPQSACQVASQVASQISPQVNPHVSSQTSSQISLHAGPQASAQTTAQASAFGLGTSASTAADMDDVMQLVYAHNPRPVLPKVLWGEIAKFGSRHDVLNLRSTSTDIAKWVDKSISTLSVNADQAHAMLTALGNATNFKHIHALRIEGCSNLGLPSAIQALAALPHGTLHVELRRDRYAYSLDTLAVEYLTSIAPASLRLTNFGAVTASGVQILSRLPYPIHLSTGHVRGAVHDDKLHALANIPQLRSLDVMISAVDDIAAQALAAHPTLTELRLDSAGYQRIVISDAALIALANSTTLKSLHFVRMRTDFDKSVIAAFAANSSMDFLCLGGADDIFDEAFTLAMSKNVTLKTLHVALRSGAGHLAKIPSLERLFIGGQISLDDARQFAEHGHLKALYAHRCHFEPGALTVIAGCPIVDVLLNNPVTLSNLVGQSIPALTDADVDAFLGNNALRSLMLVVSTGLEADITQAIRLAGHPTLQSLSICYFRVGGNGQHSDFEITVAQQAALSVAWGAHRSIDALSVTVI